MSYDPMQELLIDALNGLGVPFHKLMICEKAGLATVEGGGFGSTVGVWKQDVLRKMTVEELQTLYGGLKEEQMEDRIERAKSEEVPR